MGQLKVRLWIDTLREKTFIADLEKLCKRYCKNENSYRFDFKEDG
jgi:hypothetical protein